MGFECLELLLMVEEKFDIVVPDSEAQEAETVGNLVDLVYSRLRHSEQDSYPSEDGFKIVQAAITNQFGLPHSEITPDLRLDDIIKMRSMGFDAKEIAKMVRRSVHSVNCKIAQLLKQNKIRRIYNK